MHYQRLPFYVHLGRGGVDVKAGFTVTVDTHILLRRDFKVDTSWPDVT